MRILITGIGGFVGRHFVDFLSTQNQNFDVLGIYNSKIPVIKGIPYSNINLSYLQVNLTDKKKTKNAIAEFNPEYILHLASKSSVAYSWHNPGDLVSENTTIFINIIEALRELNSSCKMLSVGSAEEYGQVGSNELPLVETYCTQPVSPYGAARVLQNNLVTIYAKNFGLNLTHTRSFNHIGPYQNEHFVIGSFTKQISEQLNAGKNDIELITGDTEVIRDFTDVRDVVRAYYLLLLKGKRGETYNVCSNVGYRLKDIITLLGKLTHTNIKCITNPNHFRPTENKEIRGSYEKLRQETGWKPEIKIEQSLSDLFEYWKMRITDNILQ